MYFRTTIVLAAALALALVADTADVNRYRTPMLAGTPALGSMSDPGPDAGDFRVRRAADHRQAGSAAAAIPPGNCSLRFRRIRQS